MKVIVSKIEAQFIEYNLWKTKKKVHKSINHNATMFFVIQNTSINQFRIIINQRLLCSTRSNSNILSILSIFISI